MKSTIKVDITLSGKPQISINAFNGWEDLRDKTLNMFLSELKPRGRLCFIDSSGSKNSGSSGEGGFSYYAITPIDPENYELLIKEIEILIKERDEGRDFPIGYLEEKKQRIESVDEWGFRKLMNY